MKSLPLGFVAVLTLSLAAGVDHANALDILAPGDAIIAFDLDAGSQSNYPIFEGPSNVVDGTAGKYLNFAGAGSGFIVTPAVGSSIVQSFQLTTANDFSGRDPSSFELWGTNDAIVSADNSAGLDENWTLIDFGALALNPAERDTPQTPVAVSNGASYSSYKMLFPSVGTPGFEMQIGEASFYASNDGSGVDLLNAGDPTLAIHFGPESNYPGGEGPAQLLDSDPNTKYLNFGKANSGFIVTPAAGATTISGFEITTANDAEERDPALWRLLGTNDPISTQDNAATFGESWTLIDQGSLGLPADRQTASGLIAVNNTQGAFTSYRMEFPALKDEGIANSMQIADVQFFATDFATLIVNRATGEVSIRADQDITFESYEVLSSVVGGLDDTSWTSIASTSADPNDAWSETSVPGASDRLAETDIPSAGADDGFTITAGNEYSLGDIWRPIPEFGEDIALTLTDTAGEPIVASIEFVGDAVLPGDYNNDGAVDITDWAVFRAGFGGDFSGISLADAYFLGDLDQDFDNDINDFNLFVQLAGGASALFGVPEPTAAILLVGYVVILVGLPKRGVVVATAVVGLFGGGLASSASAQTFTNVGGAPISATIPAGQMNETVDSGPINFFDDDFLDDPGAIDSELFLLDYNDPNLQGGPFLQYQGLGSDPKTVFFDYGSTVSANWFAYSQRSGDDPTADRVGKFEFWFSDSSFGGVTPATTPDAVYELLPTDMRLQDSALRPYSLSGTHIGRYVAMRLSVSELSADQPINNIGGHEFRLLSGPADVVLEVDRSNGELTLKNNLAGAQGIEMKAYTIESPSGGLDAAGFNGLGGDSAAFPLGNGTGNGWEVGGGSNAGLLAEGRFSGVSTLSAGVAGLSLGTGYDESSLAEDLVFTWTNSDGDVYDARVEYVGVAPIALPGDANADGKVDLLDLDILGGNFGLTPADLSDGDFNDDDVVDLLDLDILGANFGAMQMSAAAVPEPGAAMLFSLGLMLRGATHRRGQGKASVRSHLVLNAE